PPEQWVWSEEPAHDPLVDRATWDRTQAELKRRGFPVTQPTYLESPYLLTGLVRCWCGSRMHGHSTVRRNADGEVRRRYRRYLCHGYVLGGERHKAVRAEKLEGEALRAVAAIAEIPDFVERARKRILLTRMRSNTTAAKDLDNLRAELERIREKQAILYEDRLDGRVTPEQWDRFNAGLLAREEELAGRVERAEKALLAHGGGAEDVRRILGILGDFDRVFDSMDQPQRKLVLRSIVEEVRVDVDWEKPSEVRLLAPWDEMIHGEEQVREPASAAPASA
ncbi:MAG: recombinase zinc ribbon domain-containing protein, partial [Planctomycetota bacterium]